MATPFRVLELYSGIGGMHYALKESGLLYQIVQAMDINVNCNRVYKHNFPDTTVSPSSIGGLCTEDLDQMKIDMMVMSPPCQPFTRMGNKKDEDDLRTGSFLHFLNIFKKIAKHPSFMLVENVKGFESSNTRNQLIKTLQECGYNYQELLLTPKQFGVPNCRLRYYLLAKLKPLKFTFETTEEIMKCLPHCCKDWLPHKRLAETEHDRIGTEECNTCICNGHYTDDQTGETNPGKRPSGDLDGQNVKRFKSGQSEVNIDENVATLERISNTENVSNENYQSENDTVSKDCVNEKDEKLDHSSDCKRSKTEAKNSDVINTNCLQNYGLRLRLTPEERDATDGICLRVRNFLEPNWQTTENFEKYLVPRKFFKQLVPMDIVNPCSRKTACFTKRYGKFVTGGGSLLLMTTDINAIEKANSLKVQVMEKWDRDGWGDEEMETIRRLRMRYFTPQEVANIMCFPKSFRIPEEFTDKQKYMMLGNSVNVHVVSVLIKLLTA